MLDHPIHDHRAWLGSDLRPEDWKVVVPDEAVDEIRELTAHIQRNPLPTLLRTPADFPIRATEQVMKHARSLLDAGCGFTLLSALPVDDHSTEHIVAVFWILGQLIGRPVAQKFDGTMIYEVTDTGQEYSYGVRGSHTNVELNFHNDNAFGIALPRYVGLLCQRPAMSGGISRLCSIYTLHNRLLDNSPDLLARLYQPIHYDRQAEHPPGDSKTVRLAFFDWNGAELKCRANVSLIRKGFEIKGEQPDGALAEALDAVERTLADPALWVQMELGPGDLQYLNNTTVTHYRSTYQDHPDPKHRRHLYRTWHRDTGERTYNG